MTPQLLDEDFVLRGLEGTGKSPGSDAASTQSGPEGSVCERRDDIKSEFFHMCVSPLLTRGVGISKKLHGQMRPSLIMVSQQYFPDYNSQELSLELVPSLGGPATSHLPFPLPPCCAMLNLSVMSDSL